MQNEQEIKRERLDTIRGIIAKREIEKQSNGSAGMQLMPKIEENISKSLEPKNMENQGLLEKTSIEPYQSSEMVILNLVNSLEGAKSDLLQRMKSLPISEINSVCESAKQVANLHRAQTETLKLFLTLKGKSI